MRLDPAAAREALAPVARRLGTSVEEAAEGVIRVVNQQMARALHLISVEKGIDPRPFTLTAFGGAGGLHVCALAEALKMREALIPVHGGVLSALGMLAAPRGRERAHGVARLLTPEIAPLLEGRFRAMEEEGRAALIREGVSPAEIHCRRRIDLRYQGQSYSLTLPWRGADETEAAFHRLHAHRFGHRFQLPVEIDSVRVTLQGPEPTLSLAPSGEEGSASRTVGRLHGISAPVPILHRSALGEGEEVMGPALIVERVATTYLAPGWRAAPDRSGNLRLRHLP